MKRPIRFYSAAVVAAAGLLQGCAIRHDAQVNAQGQLAQDLASGACQAQTAAGGVVVGSQVKGDPAASEPPSGYRLGKVAVRANRYMVSTANPLASAAACRVLAAGGTAADAAVVALTVLGLVEPQSSGIGGGGFVMHYDAKSGKVSTYDGREAAPAAATENHLRWIDDVQDRRSPVPTYRASGRSIGTPGALRMLEAVHGEHGRLPWGTLFQPAMELAEKGFPISGRLANAINQDKAELSKSSDALAIYFGASGNPKQLGETLTNPWYAKTLGIVAEKGPSAFYHGPIAEAIVAEVNRTRRADGTEVTPGKMTLQDLAGYEAKRRDPAICSTYRGYWICGMPAPSSGGVAVASTLGILQNFDLGQYAPQVLGGDRFQLRPEAVHLIAEAERLAYADRDKYVADADFVPLPPGGLDTLVNTEYLRKRASLISMSKSMGVAAAGSFGNQQLASVATPEYGTSHVSIVDSYGNAVSMTETINSNFGSFRVVGGFVLNNVVGGSSVNPRDAAGLPVANSVGPLKRPRSSMAPTLVFDKKADGTRGGLVMVTGSPGSQAIIQYVVKTLVATLDWGLDAQQGISLMNFGADNTTTTNVGGEHPSVDAREGGKADPVASWLVAAGHKVSVSAQPSGVSSILIKSEAGKRVLEGGADPRREGLVLGY